jgi:HlyD family secretion protein
VNRRNLLTAGGLVLSAASAAAWLGCRSDSAADGPCDIVARRTVRVRLVEFGDVVARRVSPLTARISGDVTWVAEEGSPVTTGQPVLRMSTEQFETKLDAQERVRTELENQLATRLAVARAIEATGRFNVRLAEIDLELARLKLEEARAKPTPADRREAELRLTAAELRAQRAAAEWTAQQALAARGCAAEHKVKAAELDLIRSRSDMVRAQAAHRETLAGTPTATIGSIETALRKAELSLAQVKFAATVDPEVAQGEADVARTRLNSHLKRIERSRREIEAAQIVSPMDGIVALVDVYKGSSDTSPVQVGEHHKAGRELLKIADVARLQVRILVNERDVQNLSADQKATVWLAAWPGTAYPARVAEISPYADDKNRMLGPLALEKSGMAGVNVVPVLLDMDIPPGGEPPRLGSSAEVEIELRTVSDALTVPLAALHWQDGRPHVRRPGMGPDRLTPVTLDAADTQYAVVTSGLAEGERVLLRHATEAAR